LRVKFAAKVVAILITSKRLSYKSILSSKTLSFFNVVFLKNRS
jgi:hypothetical protein